MELEQIKELISHIESSKLSKFTLKKGDFELHLEKESPFLSPVRHQVAPPPSAGDSFEPERPQQPSGTFVTSPMVGTFYSSPAPDQPSFVKVGDQVQENTVVCIIEAMKVMNEVKAGFAGKIIERLAESGQPVEFGNRLFRIDPA